MAIDTNAEKLAIMEWDTVFEPAIPLSPGAAPFSRGEKQNFIWGYPGIEWETVGLQQATFEAGITADSALQSNSTIQATFEDAAEAGESPQGNAAAQATFEIAAEAGESSSTITIITAEGEIIDAVIVGASFLGSEAQQIPGHLTIGSIAIAATLSGIGEMQTVLTAKASTGPALSGKPTIH